LNNCKEEIMAAERDLDASANARRHYETADKMLLIGRALMGFTKRSQRKTNYGRITHVDSWQLAQAQTMIDLFREARGRTPRTKVELGQFLEEECAASRIPDAPIQPSPTALLKIAKYGRLV
jgi:hypothetical protein